MNLNPRRQKIQAADSQVPIILAVEDDVDNLLFISHALILLKFDFITAEDSKTAFDLATKYEIDLVLLDLVLPEMSGFELASQLRQNVLTQDMPIIAVSGLAKQQDYDRALSSGCNDYLCKPYLIDDLETKICQHLPHYKQARFKQNLKVK
ncbi:MAG: response regulator [Pleurocapsa sp.]